ncbi:MAG: hypothetical protein KDA28_07340 [Phycisphaerales bacterium]|nr:hypothetical protein [Phycisphaerales bacterium]
MADDQKKDQGAPKGKKGKDGAEKKKSPISTSLLLLSVLVMVAGVALSMVGGDGTIEPAGAGEVSSDLVQGFAPTGDGTTDGAAAGHEPDSPMDEWSPVVFRAGFSFFVGFAIAYAMRQFLKLAVIGIGLMFFGLFGLQYAGIIDVDWTILEGHYDSASSWISSQTADFMSFVQGYLPSAALAGAGLVTGFRKK